MCVVYVYIRVRTFLCNCGDLLFVIFGGCCSGISERDQSTNMNECPGGRGAG